VFIHAWSIVVDFRLLVKLRGAKVPALKEQSPFGAESSPQGFVLLAHSFSSGQLAAKARPQLCGSKSQGCHADLTISLIWVTISCA
jgi:hypothetical protein